MYGIMVGNADKLLYDRGRLVTEPNVLIICYYRPQTYGVTRT